MTETATSFNARERHDILDIAFRSISHGLERGVPAPLQSATQLPAGLQAVRASFVTLKIADALRGCIGTLEAVRPLVEDVNENAFAAAFRDPRFLPMTMAEFQSLQISISVLSVPEPMRFTTEEELVAQLNPGFDGLILEEGRRRGTFLPAVWENLPEPRDFLRQLKLKAGLHPDSWSPGIRVYRYHAEVIDGEE